MIPWENYHHYDLLNRSWLLLLLLLLLLLFPFLSCSTAPAHHGLGGFGWWHNEECTIHNARLKMDENQQVCWNKDLGSTWFPGHTEVVQSKHVPMIARSKLPFRKKSRSALPGHACSWCPSGFFSASDSPCGINAVISPRQRLLWSLHDICCTYAN